MRFCSSANVMTSRQTNFRFQPSTPLKQGLRSQQCLSNRIYPAWTPWPPPRTGRASSSLHEVGPLGTTPESTGSRSPEPLRPGRAGSAPMFGWGSAALRGAASWAPRPGLATVALRRPVAGRAPSRPAASPEGSAPPRPARHGSRPHASRAPGAGRPAARRRWSPSNAGWRRASSGAAATWSGTASPSCCTASARCCSTTAPVRPSPGNSGAGRGREASARPSDSS